MILRKLTVGVLSLVILSCNASKQESTEDSTYSDVKIVGEMKNVMWKGELAGNIVLDTILNKKGLYGLGPESFLKGELLIFDGQIYNSKVTSDSTMEVSKTYTGSAPFFVYANVYEWLELELPSNIKTILDLEKFVQAKTVDMKKPFAFKLNGEIVSAIIHIQNLPEGTKVSSPDEAHQGQVNYRLKNQKVKIVGFFSTEHKGVFTHHDSFLHMHLLSEDGRKMGHLDKFEIDNMKLYLPKN